MSEELTPKVNRKEVEQEFLAKRQTINNHPLELQRSLCGGLNWLAREVPRKILFSMHDRDHEDGVQWPAAFDPCVRSK